MESGNSVWFFYYFEVFHKKFSTKKKTELFSRPYKRASPNITVRVDLHEATMGIKENVGQVQRPVLSESCSNKHDSSASCTLSSHYTLV